MGIVNTTPDSFSDGGVNADAETPSTMPGPWQKPVRCCWMSAVSRRGPGSDPVDEAEEWRRIEPVIATLVADGLKVSCDTRKAAIMQQGDTGRRGDDQRCQRVDFEPDARMSRPWSASAGVPDACAG